MNINDNKWLRRFHQLASEVASWSKDLNRQVGCVLVSEDGQVLSTGYNGLPPGVEDKPERMERPAKYLWTSHAEANAVAQAARHGIKLYGATAFVTLAPCSSCARSLIVSGVKRAVFPAPDLSDERWGQEFQVALAMFKEAGVEVVEIRERGQEPERVDVCILYDRPYELLEAGNTVAGDSTSICSACGMSVWNPSFLDLHLSLLPISTKD